MSKMHDDAGKNIFNYARDLRREQTDAEKILWELLRNRRLDGYKFRRQHTMLVYIVDFYCFEKKLIIEVDGSVHNEEEQKNYDRLREKELTALGARVIRFTNDDVMNNKQNVLRTISDALKEKRV